MPAKIYNLNGKVLIDIANALDFSHGMPPLWSLATLTHSVNKSRALFHR
jgi:hypothetical protein